jgi:hypothetical protein
MMSNYNLQKATPLQEQLYQETLKTLKPVIVTQKLADLHKVKLNQVSVVYKLLLLSQLKIIN